MALTKVTGSVIEVASQAEAEAGTVVDKFMTPERVAQALVAQAPATAQVFSLSNDATYTLTPNVVDSIYRITGFMMGNTDGVLYVQTSDDGGTNFTDTAGDTSNAYFWRLPSSLSSGASTAQVGFPLQIQAAGAAGDDEHASFQAILAYNGYSRISYSATGFNTDSVGNIGVYGTAGATLGNHDSGINRIRFIRTGSTMVGTIMVESLRLS